MSLFTLENINKINIGDGSGTFIGVCGIAGGVSVEGNLNVGGTGEYTGELNIDSGSGTGVVISTGSYNDGSGPVIFNNGPTQIDGGSVSSTVITGTTNGTFGSTMTVASGSITDSGASISFGSNDLSTTGTIDFSGGVSLRGGVSINAFTFPSALAPVAGRIFTTDASGVISLTPNGGGGTSVGASSGILITEGTCVSVNVGAGLNFGEASQGTSTVQLNLYSSGNLQFYPEPGSVGSSVGLCSSIIVPDSVTVGESATSDRVVLTTSGTSGGAIQFYNNTPTLTMELFAGTLNGGEGAEIHLGDEGTQNSLNLYGGVTNAGVTGPVLDLSVGGTKGIEMTYYGETHDLPEISLFESGGTSTVKIYSGTGFVQDSGQIELYSASGSNPEIPIVQLGANGTGSISLNSGGDSFIVTIGASSGAIEDTFFTLPGAIPAQDGYVLSSDTSGILSWVANGGGGSGVSSLNDLNDAKVVSTSLILGNKGQTATPLSGANNVAVGVSALFAETTGENNVAIGYNAMEYSQSSNDNIAIGMSTLNLYAGGGGFNTVVGSNSAPGVSSTIVTGLTIIGASSGVTIDTDLSNLTLIGYQVETTGDTSDSVYIGNNAVNNVYIKGNILVTSDGRDKTDVEDSTYGLNIVDNLRPVEFTWDRRPIVPGDAENTTNGQRTVGLIAQEVRDSLTEEENKILNLVNDSSEERFHMCYNNLIPILVKAVKDLKAEVDTLKQRMDACSC